MQPTFADPVPPFQGTAAAWQDAYALALGAAKIELGADACVSRAAVAMRLYGVELQPHAAVNLDLWLGVLMPV